MSKVENIEHPSYVFGSSIITIVLGSLGFLVALSWNAAIQKTFEYYEKGSEEIDARFSFAFLITAIAIVLIFFTVYFVQGKRI
jgi:heme/copper-type cytochrome/quinol oxidase subunit 2